MSRLAKLTILVVTGALFSVLGVGEPAPADAGATLQVTYATVSKINDGDTFEIDWDQGDSGPSGLLDQIRLVGVDTNEVSTSQCFADAAESFVEARIPIGTVVRLEAQDPRSAAGNRPLRHVLFGPGYSRNLALELVEAGLGLAASYDVEPHYRDLYMEAGERAYLNKVGMWNPGACGGNPSNWPEIEVLSNNDASGIETSNVNGEWIQIRNLGPGTLVMNGWTIRSSGRNNGRTLEIPNGTTVAVGAKVRIHMGSGTNTSKNIYIGRTTPFLDNNEEVLYIRDRDFNIRYFQVWPCTITCGTYGTLAIEAVSYDPPGVDDDFLNQEWVTVRNVGSGPLDLTDWKLQDNSADYRFADGKTLAPGQALTIHIGSGKDKKNRVYWGNNEAILTNAGTELRVFNQRNIEVDCYAYGNSTCRDEGVRGAVEVAVHYNAKGNDATHPNREWIGLTNTSGDRVNLSGYQLRYNNSTYTFPSGSRIEPGARLRVFMGTGAKTATRQYWGFSTGTLANSGGKVALLDRDRQVLREARWQCGDCGADGPFEITRVKSNAKGNDKLNVNGEWIRIRNTGLDTASLRGYMVTVGKKQYHINRNTQIAPGASVRIRIGKGSNTRKNLYWGRSAPILRNRGGAVLLHSPQREVVSCKSWGNKACPA